MSKGTVAPTTSKCAPEGWKDNKDYSCNDYGSLNYCDRTTVVYPAISSFVELRSNAGYDGSDCKECGCVEDAPGKNNNTLLKTVYTLMTMNFVIQNIDQ